MDRRRVAGLLAVPVLLVTGFWGVIVAGEFGQPVCRPAGPISLPPGADPARVRICGPDAHLAWPTVGGAVALASWIGLLAVLWALKSRREVTARHPQGRP